MTNKYRFCSRTGRSFCKYSDYAAVCRLTCCFDSRQECTSWAKYCKIQQYMNYMKTNCKKTCGYCWWSFVYVYCTAQKMKFSIKHFFSKCDQNRRNLRIWSHLLKKSLIENFVFCAMLVTWFFETVAHLDFKLKMLIIEKWFILKN